MVDASRRIRRSCALRLGARALLGSTVTVSEGALAVELREALDVLPATGSHVTFQLVAFEGEPAVEGSAEVTRAERGTSKSRAGEVVTLHLSLGVGPAREQLTRLVREYRDAVLVVDESATDAKALAEMLGEELRVVVCSRASDAVNALREDEFAAVVSAERVGAVHVIDFFQKVTELLPGARTMRLVASDFTLSENLFELVNEGKIFSFLRKPFRAREVVTAVRRAVDAYVLASENERLAAELERANSRLSRENAQYQKRLTGGTGFEAIIGQSPALQRALSEAARVRQSSTTAVHLCGETGTGKELVARAIHSGSPRAAGPFVAHNCGGMTETLLQSTLFGHQKGAFTGADRDQPGLFQTANGGTLFLDEVAELSPLIQSSLLRVLQDGEVTPVGATQSQKVDVRIVSATHQQLQQRVRDGHFREDLYFRLVVISIELPPLRERKGDITLLAQHVLDVRSELHGRRIPGFTPEALEALERYRWPGNVRELENVIERMLVLADDGQPLALALLPAEVRGAVAAPDVVSIPASLGLDDAVEELKRELIDRALNRTDGTISQAAKALGVERTRLAKLRRRLGGD